MNYKRIGRLAVCLLLVCCLIVNISPIKAEAVSSMAVVGIGAGLAATTALIGLGLQAGGTSKALQEISDSAVSALESGALGDFVVNGMVNAVKYARPDGTYGFALSLGLLEALKTWFFGEGIIKSGSAFSSVASFFYNGSTFTVKPTSGDIYLCVVACPSFSYHIRAYCTTSSRCRSEVDGVFKAYSDPSLQDSGYYSASISGFSNALYGVDLKSIGLPVYYFSTSSEMFNFIPGSAIGTDYDLTLGEVGTADQTVEEAHSDWVAGSIAVPGSLVGSDTEEKYVPVGLPADQTEALGKTQEEVQSGVGTYDDTLVDTETDSDAVTGTGTIADVITEIKALPQKIADVLADVIAGVKAIPQVISEALAKAFAISDTFIATKVEALTLKYPYLDTFLALGTDLKAYFLSLGTKPPIIYIDLGAATGSYCFGGRQAFIDLSWYAAYKPTMDSVLGAFIWLWLAWRIFLSLPGIIHGSSGVAGSIVRYLERSTKANDGGVEK